MLVDWKGDFAWKAETPAPAPAKADCVALKKAMDAAKTAGVQANIDTTTADWKKGGCGASALYGSLVAVAVGIFATAF